MMSEASFASLGPTLLARKGGAKPAMRPQLTPLPENLSEMAALAEEQLEDLGWNDMGADRDLADGIDQPSAQPLPLLSTKPAAERKDSAEIVSIDARAARPAPANEDALDDENREAQSLILRKQADRLAENVIAKRLAAPAKAASLNKPKASAKAKEKSTSKSGKRAAFTLRLDTDRHLKLRLAATMQGVSAQSLVTKALDALFDDIEQLETLVDGMKRT